MRRVVVLALFALAACRSTPIPNMRMSAEPGPLQREYERLHPHEVDTPSTESCTPSIPSVAITELSLERNACYGFCAMYTLTLRSDGTAEYHGYGNVAKLGAYRGSIAPPAFDQLAQLAEEIGVFEMQARYYCLITDQSTAYVSIVRGGERKTIRHYGPSTSGPLRLRWFEQLLDESAEAIEWRRVSPAK
jgi:hypothetical protein